MPAEVTLFDKIAEDRLIDPDRMRISSESKCEEGINELLGKHNISQPDRGKQKLVKCAHENHTPAAIEALERRDRRAGETEFAIIIVFQQVGVCALGPRQSLEPTLVRHYHSQRKLVGWRQIGDSR